MDLRIAGLRRWLTSISESPPPFREGLGVLRQLAAVVAAATLCSACQSIIDNLIGPSDGLPPRCDLGYKGSKDDCQSIATLANCVESEYYSGNGTCIGLRCEPVAVPGTALKRMCNGIGVYVGGGTSAADTWLGSLAPMPPRSEVASTPAAASASAIAVSRKRLAAVGAVTITEYAVPQAGVRPGPIIASGQRLLFGSTVNCSGPCDVYQIDLLGRITRTGSGCGTPTCRLTGLAPTGDGGYCYGQVNSFFPPGHPEQGERASDVISCRSGTSVYAHFLKILDGLVAGLALGSDGRIWYTEARWNGIGRIGIKDTATVEASYLDPATHMGFAAITSGPDGRMWFTAVTANQIGRISTSDFRMITIPTTDSQPSGITAGPDGNLWFTEFNGNKIGRITPTGVITEFALPTANAQPLGIAAGPDGALWFTEFNANKIGRITRFGDITEYTIPTANSQPAGIAAGPDGNLWFTEYQGNKIGQVTLPPPSTLPQVIEFYNVNLDHYFITASAAEAAAIDSGSAGPGWSRTSGTFASGGNVAVCRFFGSISPGPNSHFYTGDVNECASLKSLQATTPSTQKRWNFESNDFITTAAINGVCPSGLLPVHRAYNNGFARGVDSNHRITASPGAIAEVVQRGWANEGVVMCAPQ